MILALLLIFKDNSGNLLSPLSNRQATKQAKLKFPLRSVG